MTLFTERVTKSRSNQVQIQARERRRSDRKEKRELDKEKALAEYRARELEGMCTACFSVYPPFTA